MILRKRTFVRRMIGLGACNGGIYRFIRSDLGVEKYIRKYFRITCRQPPFMAANFDDLNRGYDINWLYFKTLKQHPYQCLWEVNDRLTEDQFIAKIRKRFGEKR